MNLHRLAQLRARIHSLGAGIYTEPCKKELDLDELSESLWPELSSCLPDSRFPIGVTEIRAYGTLAMSTSIGLYAIREAQQNKKVYTAWIERSSTLYAPGVAVAGIDLSRFVVIRPKLSSFCHVAHKTVDSGIFAVTVIEFDAFGSNLRAQSVLSEPKLNVFVRKLALSASKQRAVVLLLTDEKCQRSFALPTALRLELSSIVHDSHHVRLCIGKERYGRVGYVKNIKRTLPFHLSSFSHSVQTNYTKNELTHESS